MVLCSIEEAWGSSFNQSFNYHPGTSQTYQKKNNQPSKNRYRYNFHRSSEPLPNHNGSYRDQNVYDVTLDNNPPPEEEYHFENQTNFSNSNLTPIESNNKNINNRSHKKQLVKNLSGKNINDLEPLYDNDNDDNYENFDSQSYNENSDDEFDITKLNKHYDRKKKKKKVEQDNNSDTSSDDDDDDDDDTSDNITNLNTNKIVNQNNINNNKSELGKVKVNVNLNELNQKFNDLVKVIEKYTMTNGNDMKDIFLFIFLGIFVIFILDLIFRIGQKLKS